MKGERTFDARESALEILYAVDHEGRFVSHLLTTLQKRPGIDPHQRGLTEKIVKGVLEQKTEIDRTLEGKLSKGLASLPPRVQAILRMAIYQLRYLDRVEKAVVVDSAVALAKRHSSKTLGGVVNAILRGYLREEKPIAPEKFTSAEEISEGLSHPKWIVDRWLSQVGLDETVALCKLNNSDTPLYLRVNSTQCDRDALAKILAKEGIITEPGKYARESLRVVSLPKKKRLHEVKAFEDGLFTIQDQGACLVGELGYRAPRVGSRALFVDLCAAPGGKTTHLASLVRDQGEVIAVDPTEKRLNLVRENCDRLRLSNVTYRCADGRSFKIDSEADVVLVDAPCSGLGVLGRRADLRWQRGEDTLKELQSLQFELLKQAATLVKVGGRIVYSTCTTTREENEEIVNKFLKSDARFEIDPISSVSPDLITQEGFLRTWPQRHRMGGGFVALLTRAE